MEMNRTSYKKGQILKTSILKAFSMAGLLVALILCAVPHAFSQQKFSQRFPATRNIRLQLTNRTGTITVQGWERDEVRVTASLERPYAKVEPQVVSGTILINVVRDNQGRNEVGDANFSIFVPYYSVVDIETRIGNLNVSNIQGVLVRAHISSEGDVTLTNISALSVSAKNVIGDIFYDGLIQPKGTYRFTSTSGNINLRIPIESSFKLVATAPSTRNIALGSFFTTSMRYLGTGRRVAGMVGDGSASVTVTNQRGTISFIRR